MTHVFISYSNKDRDLAASLATALEAQGFSVWWDFNLVGGVNFRKEILEQLNAARAVIVIWTENSVISEFVLDEADHAKSEKKFIPVRAGRLEIRSIPLGYRSAQTYPVSDTDRIIAALKALGLQQDVKDNGLPRAGAAQSRDGSRIAWRGLAAGIVILGALGAAYFLPGGKPPILEEESTWVQSKAKWTSEAMGNYLDKYPQGPHAKWAKALMKTDMGILCKSEGKWFSLDSLDAAKKLDCKELKKMEVRQHNSNDTDGRLGGRSKGIPDKPAY